MGEAQIDLSSAIQKSFESFAASIQEHRWFGRENEAVNAFAMGSLLSNLIPIGFHPTQVGIEVAVPQNPGAESPKGRAKKAVRKDLVIWPKAWMTCFDGARDKPSQYPLCVLEWKVDHPKEAADLRWLEDHAENGPLDGFSGYRVTMQTNPFGIVVDRVLKNETKLEWWTT